MFEAQGVNLIFFYFFFQVKGLKKLENFQKREEELEIWRKHSTPEDVEYFECQLELQQELLKSYNRVERIIGTNFSYSPDGYVSHNVPNILVSFPAEFKKADGLPDYYIKWESLPYSEATWEDASLIINRWPDKLQEFRDREDSKRTPSKTCKVLRHRPKFVKIETQPEYLGGKQVGFETRFYV